MGIFNLFNKEKKLATTDNGISGPVFLDGLTEHINQPRDLQPHEWRRRLRTGSGQTKFKIRFYGQRHEEHSHLIVATGFAPSLVVAVDASTGQEIVLFDGCKHGYNALFCDTFSDEQLTNRPVTNFYTDLHGNDLFEIIVSTYNGIDYDDEFLEQVDDNGFIELIDGSKMEFEKAKRNGFDTLQICATDINGETYEIVSEELA